MLEMLSTRRKCLIIHIHAVIGYHIVCCLILAEEHFVTVCNLLFAVLKAFILHVTGRELYSGMCLMLVD